MGDWRWILAAVCLLAGPARANCDGPDPVELNFDLASLVPYSVRVEDDGRLLVLGARQETAPAFRDVADPCVGAVGSRPDAPGWTVTTVALNGRFALSSVDLRRRSVGVRLSWLGPLGEDAGEAAPAEDALPLIVLDPGHGGVDAGAVREGLKESDLTLAFARALAEALIRTGRFQVALTRTGDAFLTLADRVAFAHDSGASAFVSLHADALDEGEARGAAVFTLSAVASDEAAAELVAIHDRADLLIGETLTGAGDQLTGVLLDLARADTGPRSQALVGAIVDALTGLPDALRKSALRSANFGVLKASDIPSVLVELGFLSDETDRAHLQDPAWREAAVEALRDGIVAWFDEDAVASGLRRK